MKKWIKKHLPPVVVRWGRGGLEAVKSLAGWPGFLRDFWRFKKISSSGGRKFKADFYNILPMFGDATSVTSFDHHYIYHPAWAARVVKLINPPFHTDIGSTLYFSTLLSAFIPVKFYDYRPAAIQLGGLSSGHADLVGLPFKDNELFSLSCMHTVEHIGLGRYGDPLDAEGDLKAIRELSRVTAPGGNLLFVVPIGQPKIMFNAHRIYSYRQILEYFSGLKLKEFSLVTDPGFGQDFISNASEEQADSQLYGCGCFWFTKNI